VSDYPVLLISLIQQGVFFNRFIIDDSIVAAIEDHCTVAVPPLSSYSLVRKDELPKNYILSPLMKKPRASENVNFNAIQMISSKINILTFGFSIFIFIIFSNKPQANVFNEFDTLFP